MYHISIELQLLHHPNYHYQIFRLRRVSNMSAEYFFPVRARQQGLQCDGCFRWQHRTCGTGISQCDNRYAVQTGASIDWRCVTFQSMSLSMSPVAESTPVDFSESLFTLHEPLADPAESTPVMESTPIADRTPVDFTASSSALHEPLVDPAADESSIFEPLPAPVENADANFRFVNGRCHF